MNLTIEKAEKDNLTVSFAMIDAKLHRHQKENYFIKKVPLLKLFCDRGTFNYEGPAHEIDIHDFLVRKLSEGNLKWLKLQFSVILECPKHLIYQFRNIHQCTGYKSSRSKRFRR